MSRLVEEAVPAALAGERVDRVVAMLTDLPRSEVARLVAGGRVLVDGQPVTVKGRRLAEGERLAVDVPEPAAPSLAADPLVPVPVVAEDGEVIVVDKPPGLVVHPGAGHQSGTLVHGLLARFPDLADIGAGDPARPGIVHRLDAGTSGLLVVARTAAAYEDLVAQLQARLMVRRYTALVLGTVDGPSGVIDAPVGRATSDPTRMAVAAGGRPARTRYEVEARFTDPVPATLLQCSLETGRTHQVRVHLAAIGHPVAGDRRYGGARAAVPLDRPFLHAHHLSFRHPGSSATVAFDSPLPADLEAVRARFR